MEPKLTSRTRRTTPRSSPRKDPVTLREQRAVPAGDIQIRYNTSHHLFSIQNKHPIPLHCFNGGSKISNILHLLQFGGQLNYESMLINGNMEPKLISRTRRTTARSSPRRDPVILREAESCSAGYVFPEMKDNE
ncbi:hypothetical protein CEXT_316101 [Caerostris extrusa]|uniref:Uncharacterized protein n=1 Tax=Caerostris extrusa TaxID=172846 RepID=A0AAV4MM87_CAEEX|nr:hypothetical protein CEXT_316101 [Caerostris extrusa]